MLWIFLQNLVLPDGGSAIHPLYLQIPIDVAKSSIVARLEYTSLLGRAHVQKGLQSRITMFGIVDYVEGDSCWLATTGIPKFDHRLKREGLEYNIVIEGTDERGFFVEKRNPYVPLGDLTSTATNVILHRQSVGKTHDKVSHTLSAIDHNYPSTRLGLLGKTLKKDLQLIWAIFCRDNEC